MKDVKFQSFFFKIFKTFLFHSIIPEGTERSPLLITNAAKIYKRLECQTRITSFNHSELSISYITRKRQWQDLDWFAEIKSFSMKYSNRLIYIKRSKTYQQMESIDTRR